jgi:hypothetical protein
MKMSSLGYRHVRSWMTVESQMLSPSARRVDCNAGEHCIKEQFEIGDGMEFDLRLCHTYNALAIGATSQFKGYSIHQRLT